VILGVLLEVRLQIVDTGRQQGNLTSGEPVSPLAWAIQRRWSPCFSGHCHFKLSFIVATQPQFDRASASWKIPFKTESVELYQPNSQLHQSFRPEQASIARFAHADQALIGIDANFPARPSGNGTGLP
jgi:hypothetical protein